MWVMSDLSSGRRRCFSSKSICASAVQHDPRSTRTSFTSGNVSGTNSSQAGSTPVHVPPMLSCSQRWLTRERTGLIDPNGRGKFSQGAISPILKTKSMVTWTGVWTRRVILTWLLAFVERGEVEDVCTHTCVLFHGSESKRSRFLCSSFWREYRGIVNSASKRMVRDAAVLSSSVKA